MQKPPRVDSGGRAVWRQSLVTGYASTVPTQRSTPQHTVAVDNDLWQTARKIAALRHEKISDVIRQALVRYVQRHKHLLDND
jgi:hypothetical protein